MSSIDEISQMIEHLYTMERIITAIQKRPIDYGGVSLHANEAHTLKMIALNEGISQTELSEQMYRTKGATLSLIHIYSRFPRGWRSQSRPACRRGIPGPGPCTSGADPPPAWSGGRQC